MIAYNQSDKNIGPDRKIEEIYAIVATGPQGEGLMAFDTVLDGQRCFIPLVGTGKEIIPSMIKQAKQIQAETGQSFCIYRFSNKEDVSKQFI